MQFFFLYTLSVYNYIKFILIAILFIHIIIHSKTVKSDYSILILYNILYYDNVVKMLLHLNHLFYSINYIIVCVLLCLLRSHRYTKQQQQQKSQFYCFNKDKIGIMFIIRIFF